MNSSKVQPKHRLFVVAAAVAAGVWLFLWSRQPSRAVPATRALEASEGSEPLAPRVITQTDTPSTPKVEVASDGLPIMPAGPNDPIPAGPVHPHPITAQHQRVFGENRLIGALNGAMDVKDVPALRRLLKQYREQYPEDPNQLQAGYQVIADCLEQPGAASTAAGQRYYTEQSGSALHRFVGRYCLAQ